MAFSLKLSAVLRKQLWKVKIRDRERLEYPHVSIMMKGKTWRYSLRGGTFLDKKPDPGDVPEGVVAAIEKGMAKLIGAWNKMYPKNPV